MKLIENTTNKVYTAQIMDDESFEIEALHLGVNDPCYALFRFQHADAPLPNVEATFVKRIHLAKTLQANG